MQPNEIALTVDPLNDGTTEVQTYSRHEEHLNRSLYIGESHEPGMRNIMCLYRTPAKPTATFKGVQKCAIKFTEDESVATSDAGTIVSPEIDEISFSIPVGITAAAMLVRRQRMIAILDNDMIMDDLCRLNVV